MIERYNYTTGAYVDSFKFKFNLNTYGGSIFIVTQLQVNNKQRVGTQGLSLLRLLSIVFSRNTSRNSVIRTGHFFSIYSIVSLFAPGTAATFLFEQGNGSPRFM